MKKTLENLEDISFIVFFGSQTGQAESIAGNIVEEASTYDFKAQAFPLNEISDATDLTRLNCPIVIITSTTGDGEPPENCDKFWRKIRKKILKPGLLDSVNYALLGLGDTNYNNFCNCGKEINKRLQSLGASAFHPSAWADDAVGLELVVEDWIEGLWSALTSFLRPESFSAGIMAANKDSGGLTLPPCPPKSLVVEYLKDSSVFPVDLENPIQPYPLMEGMAVKTKITNARLLTKNGALKTALEITLQFQSLKLGFEPGDAIGIVCPNPDGEVQDLLTRLDILPSADKSAIFTPKENAKGKIPNFIQPGSTLRQLFTYFSDIRTPPKKTFLRLLAEFTTEETEKKKLLELSSRQGATEFESTIRGAGLSLLDILLTFPSCNPPAEILIEHLPRLIPRAYSISSSPLQNKDSFTFAFNVITFDSADGRKYNRTGVCTGWLYKLCRKFIKSDLDNNSLEDMFQNMAIDNAGDKGDFSNDSGDQDIIIYKRKNHNFRLPETLTSPIIMVGPGTGIAPFVGFLEHRNLQVTSADSLGEMHLYFGCRNKFLDFLYQDELTKLQESKTLSKFYTSFSRDPDNNGLKYVQDNINANKEEVVKVLVDQGGFLYVCGDAKNMAKNVRETLTQCVQLVKELSEADAKSVVNELVSSKRYLQDVWA